MTNALKTVVLLGALSALLLVIGDVAGGRNGLILALGFAAVMNFVSYFWSDKIALMMNGARPVTREELPHQKALWFRSWSTVSSGGRFDAEGYARWREY